MMASPSTFSGRAKRRAQCRREVDGVNSEDEQEILALYLTASLRIDAVAALIEPVDAVAARDARILKDRVLARAAFVAKALRELAPIAVEGPAEPPSSPSSSRG